MRYLVLTSLALCVGCANAPTIADLNPFGADPNEPRVRTGPVDTSARNNQAAGWDTLRAPEGTPVLYGRDGSPVGSSTPGQVQQSPGPLNSGVDATGGSRVVLLDLYDQVKQERDELLLDFDDIAAENDAAAATITTQQARIAALESQVATLSKRNGELDAIQLELAGRLAQAQIARLEAERALLEASLEWRRMNAANTRASVAEEPKR